MVLMVVYHKCKHFKSHMLLKDITLLLIKLISSSRRSFFLNNPAMELDFLDFKPEILHIHFAKLHSKALSIDLK